MDRLVKGSRELNIQSQDVIEHAVKVLGLDETAEYEITYMARHEVSLLRDPDEIIDGIDFDLGTAVDEMEILMAIEYGVQNVILPSGFHVVGMSKKVTPAVKRVFGVVDFSCMGVV